MKCADAQVMIEEMVLWEPRRRPSHRLADHVQGCERCREDAEHVASLLDGLPTLLAEVAPCPAPAIVKRRVMSSLQAPASRREAPTRRRSLSLSLFDGWRSLAVVTVCAVVVPLVTVTWLLKTTNLGGQLIRPVGGPHPSSAPSVITASPTPSGQSTLIPVDTTVALSNLADGLVVAVAASPANGIAVSAAQPTGDRSQLFTFSFAEDQSTEFFVTSALSPNGVHYLLTEDLGSRQVKLSFDNNTTQQIWWSSSQNAAPGYHFLHNLIGRACLTDSGSHTQLVVVNCDTGDPHQQWRLQMMVPRA